MCIGSTPKAPKANVPTEAEIAASDRAGSNKVKASKSNVQGKAALAKGRSSTVFTGGQGLQTSASTQQKTLLGY